MSRRNPSDKDEFDKSPEDPGFNFIKLPHKDPVKPERNRNPMDPPQIDWTSEEDIIPIIRNIEWDDNTKKRFELDVHIGEYFWKLNEMQLNELVRSFIISRVRKKDFGGFKIIYPDQFKFLQSEYLIQVQSNHGLYGLKEKFILTDYPQKVQSLINSMLFFGYEALIKRTKKDSWTEQVLNKYVSELANVLSYYFQVSMSGLVSRDLLAIMNWNSWSLPVSKESENYSGRVQDIYIEKFPYLHPRKSRPQIGDPHWTELEFGVSSDSDRRVFLGSTRIVVPRRQVSREVIDHIGNDEYPILFPHYYFSSRWWFVNAVWQIAWREHRYVNFDKNCFFEKHPIMAWYPDYFERFGPP